MDSLRVFEEATHGGLILVRASALLYILGLVDGLLEAEADTDQLIHMLIADIPSKQDVELRG